LVSALGRGGSPRLLSGALRLDRASVDFARRRKAWGTWLFGALQPEASCGEAGSRSAVFCPGRWLNGPKRPVLKHGPRSLTSMRVFGFEARPRNESECRREPRLGCTVDRSRGLPKDLSKSIAVGTRKMVNYA
jgi:hypothetical protein